MHVRPALPADIPAITAIYAEDVRAGTGTFEEVPPSPSEMADRLAHIRGAGWPWLVGEVEGVVAGYAYAAQVRDRSAWRYACEDSIYVSRTAHRRGVGAALLGALIPAAREAGFRQMLALIGDSSNLASIGLHRRFGFDEVGTMRDVGYKFGRWLDVVTMQRSLPEQP